MTLREEFLKSCLVLDTETTNQDRNIAEVIESGFVIRDNNSWSIFQELHAPSITVPPTIESICYITNEMVQGHPSFVDSAAGFQDIVNGFKVMVAHNITYDRCVLERYSINFADKPWICTWRMARKLFNGDETVEATNLPYLRFRFDLDVDINLRCHRAGNDSYITALLMEYMLDVLEQKNIINPDLPYTEQILAWLEDPIIYALMPFGKHKGEKMEKVPLSYWSWALKNMDSLKEDSPDYDPDFAASIEHAITVQTEG